MVCVGVAMGKLGNCGKLCYMIEVKFLVEVLDTLEENRIFFEDFEGNCYIKKSLRITKIWKQNI